MNNWIVLLRESNVRGGKHCSDATISRHAGWLRLSECLNLNLNLNLKWQYFIRSPRVT
jgi:hypothetical protein